MALEGLQHQAAHLVGVGGQGQRQHDLDQPQRVVMRHVAHCLGDEFRVGNDDGGAVVHLDFGGAHVDAPNVALDAAQRDPVADLDRPLGQHDQARDKVLHHRLQAKANADRQRAGDPRDALQPDAQCRQPHRHRKNSADIAKQRGRRQLHARVQRRGWQKAGAQPVLEQAHGGQAQHHNQQRLQQRQRLELEFANRNALLQLVGALEQLGRPLAVRRQQQHQGQHQHQQPARARQQHGGLAPHPEQRGRGHILLVRLRLLMRLPGLRRGRAWAQQGGRTVVNHHAEQIRRAQHHHGPDHLLQQKAAQRHIAQQQRQQAAHHDRSGQHQQATEPHRAAGPLRRSIAVAQRLMAGAPGTQQGQPNQQRQRQRHQQIHRHGGNEAGIGLLGQPLHGPDQHDERGQRDGQPAQPERQRIGQRQQPPRRPGRQQQSLPQARHIAGKGGRSRQPSEQIGRRVGVNGGPPQGQVKHLRHHGSGDAGQQHQQPGMQRAAQPARRNPRSCQCQERAARPYPQAQQQQQHQGNA